MKQNGWVMRTLIIAAFCACIMLPNVSAAKFGLKDLVNKAKDQIEGASTTEKGQNQSSAAGISSGTQAGPSSANNDSIVFSTIPVSEPANTTNTISAGENIYGLAIFEKPLREVIQEKDGTLQLTITVKIAPSDMYKTYKVPADSELADSRYLPFEIAPDADTPLEMSAPEAFPRILSWQKEGSPEVEVNIMAKPVGGTSSDIIAEGSFTLEANEAGAEKYAALEQQIKAGVDKKKSMPKPAQKNKALEQQAMAALQKGSRLEFRRIVIMESDWTVERDGLGNILHKRIKVGAGVKTAKGGCRVNLYYVKKDYLGGGKYSNTVTRLSTIPGGTDIACENISK